MTIQLGGLATGLDTTSIITKLMDLERAPITRMETDKTTLNDRLTAFTELDTHLKSFADKIKNLNYSSTLLQRSVKQSSQEYLSASVNTKATSGASYQVEVVALAQVQKSISAKGYADVKSTTFGTGALTLKVGDTTHSINIAAGSNSLEGIAKAVNDADLGVSAAIINTGDAAEPYRLILTGSDTGQSYSMDGRGLTGGTAVLGTINIADGTDADGKSYITNPPVQEASKATIMVDSVKITSDSNTLTEAIPGVTLDLLKAEVGKTTALSINVDKTGVKSTIEAFAEGYNEVVSFITGQSVINGKGGGVLGGDASINAIKRRLQNMLTDKLPNSGAFSSLSQLGFETQKDGTLEVNGTKLSAAIDKNLDGIVTLLTGEEGVTGVATQFKNYLYDMTNSSTGMLKGKKDIISSSLTKIDDKITSVEARLEQRKKTMEAQFSAMETLVSGLNSQSSYLTQQMTLLSNMTSGSK